MYYVSLEHLSFGGKYWYIKNTTTQNNKTDTQREGEMAKTQFSAFPVFLSESWGVTFFHYVHSNLSAKKNLLEYAFFFLFFKGQEAIPLQHTKEGHDVHFSNVRNFKVTWMIFANNK